MSLPGRILALDYGTRKIGIAITDPLQITASPLTTIRYKDRETLLTSLEDIFAEKEIARIVIGMPFTLDGGESDTTKEVREFVEWLRTETGIPITTLDERYTSEDAKSTLIEMGVKTGHNKDKVDSMAAAHLLRYYLDSTGGE